MDVDSNRIEEETEEDQVNEDGEVSLLTSMYVFASLSLSHTHTCRVMWVMTLHLMMNVLK